MRSASVSLIASFLLAGSSLAASPMGQLKDIDGTVYVNRGKGFEPARGSTELFQGDRVMVGEKGSATVSYYLAECDVMLGAISMTTITEKAPCKDGSSVFDSRSPAVVIAPAADVVPEAEGPPPYLLLGLAGAGAGVLGCALAGCFDEDDDDGDNGQSP
jgi:hypothetical protein